MQGSMAHLPATKVRSNCQHMLNCRSARQLRTSQLLKRQGWHLGLDKDSVHRGQEIRHSGQHHRAQRRYKHDCYSKQGAYACTHTKANVTVNRSGLKRWSRPSHLASSHPLSDTLLPTSTPPQMASTRFPVAGPLPTDGREPSVMQ